MFPLIALSLYAILILIYSIISLFVVYHLAKYVINPEIKVILISFFIIVTSGLLFSNVLLFFSLDWSSLADNLLF